MLADTLRQSEERIKLLSQNMVDSALAIGEELLQVKQQLPYGQFTAWVEEHCPFKPRQARKFMLVAETFATKRTYNAVLNLASLTELLTASEQVTDQVFEDAERGEKITANHVRFLKNCEKHEQEQERAYTADDKRAIRQRIDAAAKPLGSTDAESAAPPRLIQEVDAPPTTITVTVESCDEATLNALTAKYGRIRPEVLDSYGCVIPPFRGGRVNFLEGEFCCYIDQLLEQHRKNSAAREQSLRAEIQEKQKQINELLRQKTSEPSAVF